MKADDINYENVCRKLFEAVPELTPYYDDKMKGYEQDGPHVMYGMLLAQVLPELFEKEGDHADAIKKLFRFLELLASHPNEKVRGVVGLSTCQEITGNELVLQKSQKYMGKATKRFCEELLKP